MITLKILTPEREMLSQQVELVELPGSQGISRLWPSVT